MTFDRGFHAQDAPHPSISAVTDVPVTDIPDEFFAERVDDFDFENMDSENKDESVLCPTHLKDSNGLDTRAYLAIVSELNDFDTPPSSPNPLAEGKNELREGSYLSSEEDNEDASFSNPLITPSGINQARKDKNLNSRRPLACGKPLARARPKSIQRSKPNPAYMPNSAYRPLVRAPSSWGSFPYTYTNDGELEPRHLFNSAEMNEFIWEHPLHSRSGDKQDSKLVIWIQRNPPGSSHRWPTKDGSHRCRFHDCPAENNTINQGQWAVAFDELSSQYPDHDPFLNAGYCHLFCLERFCDFPEMCRLLNVRADNRDLKGEPEGTYGNNPMRMNNLPGVQQLEQLVDKFIVTCRQDGRPENYPHYDERDEAGQPYKGTLSHRMALFTLKHRPESVNKQELARQRKAGGRGGTLLNHMGDLNVEAPSRLRTRIHKNQDQLIANPKHNRTYRNYLADEQSGDEDDDGRQISEGQHAQDQTRGHVPTPATSHTDEIAYHRQKLRKLEELEARSRNAAAAPEKLKVTRKRRRCLTDDEDVDDTVVTHKRQRITSQTDDSSHRKGERGINIVPSTRNLNHHPNRLLPTGGSPSSQYRIRGGSQLSMPQAQHALHREDERKTPAISGRRRSFEEPRVNRKRRRSESEDKHENDARTKRQRLPVLTEHGSGQRARHGADIVPSSVNLNRPVIRKPSARQPQTLEQKHEYQRHRMQSIANANLAPPASLPTAPSQPQRGELFVESSSTAGKKRGHEEAFNPVDDVFGDLDFAGDSPSKRTRFQDQSLSLDDLGLPGLTRNIDVLTHPFSGGFTSIYDQSQGMYQQMDVSEYPKQGYTSRHVYVPPMEQYSVPPQFPSQQPTFNQDQIFQQFDPQSWDCSFLLDPSDEQNQTSPQGFAVADGLSPPPPPPPDERWLNNWPQGQPNVEEARVTGNADPRNKTTDKKKATNKTKQERPRHSDGKPMRTTVRNKTSRTNKDSQYQMLAEDYGHIWKGGKIDETALAACEKPGWKKR